MPFNFSQLRHESPQKPVLQPNRGEPGKLGGWKDSKRDGKIGWLLLYRGWVRLQERIEGFRLAMSLQAATGDVTK